MKNKTTLSIAITLSIAFLSMIGVPTASAQGASMQPVADTGIVHLERDEILIVSVSSNRKDIPVNLRFDQASFTSAGPGGGPNVKSFDRLAFGDINNDGAFTYEVSPISGGQFVGVHRVQVSCDRAPRCIVSASVHKIVLTGEGRKKEYVGHVTLIK